MNEYGHECIIRNCANAEEIQSLRLEIQGLKAALTRPQHKFTKHPEKIVVDPTRITWG